MYIIQLNKVDDLCCMKEKEKLPSVFDYYSINVLLTMYFFCLLCCSAPIQSNFCCSIYKATYDICPVVEFNQSTCKIIDMV